MYIQNNQSCIAKIKAWPSECDNDTWLRLSDSILVSLTPKEVQQVIAVLTRELQIKIAAQVQS